MRGLEKIPNLLVALIVVILLIILGVAATSSAQNPLNEVLKLLFSKLPESGGAPPETLPGGQDLSAAFFDYTGCDQIGDCSIDSDGSGRVIIPFWTRNIDLKLEVSNIGGLQGAGCADARIYVDEEYNSAKEAYFLKETIDPAVCMPLDPGETVIKETSIDVNRIGEGEYVLRVKVMPTGSDSDADFSNNEDFIEIFIEPPPPLRIEFTSEPRVLESGPFEPGDTVTARYSVKNIGETELPFVSVFMNIMKSGLLVYSVPEGTEFSLSPGQEVTRDMVFDIPSSISESGEYYLRADGYEGYNSVSRDGTSYPFTINVPPVAPANYFNYAVSEGNGGYRTPVTGGNWVELTLDVVNTGNIEAPATNLYISFLDTCNPDTTWSYAEYENAVSAMPAGGTASVTRTIPFMAPGRYQLSGIVDPTNEQSEWNPRDETGQSDNTAEIEWTIGTPSC